MPRPKERNSELRDRLLDVAIELLAAEGPAAVTTRRVAEAADTSAPAIYELFGDKAGLIRGVFFEGFRRLLTHLDKLPPPTGKNSDIVEAVKAFRKFTQANPRLFEVMYGNSFETFSPGPEEQSLGDSTRNILVERVKAATASGEMHGDPVDIAHAVLALSIGLATQETAGWLGTTTSSRQRRWKEATESLIRGYANNTAK